MEVVVIEFHLDGRSGLSPYQQLVQQVRHALRLGLLAEGDQLPKVKDVVAVLAIKPNTALKAYRHVDTDRPPAPAPPGAATRRARRRASRGGDVRQGDARRRPERGARATSAGTAPLADQGPPGRPRRGEHRGPADVDVSRLRARGDSVTVLRAQGLGKRYKRKWALSGCTLDIEPGHVTGLVGPNGAGKSTLLNIAAGMLEPTAGTIEVCGGTPGSGPEQLAKVGYVAQSTPVYTGLTIEEHLRLGAHLNPRWDDSLATKRVRRIGLDPKQHAGK